MSTFGQSLRVEDRQGWSALRPWQLNTTLCLLGIGMVWFTRNLIRENDAYYLGFSGTSAGHLILYLAAVLVFLLKPANVDRFTLPILLGFAIAARTAALFPDPFLSSDVYRYAWDGVVQHAHLNPYRYVPGDVHLSFLREPNADLYANMNRRDYAHTIYPPVAQILFYIVTAINGSVTMMKLAMILFEGLTMWGLVKLLACLNLRREWTLLYAWNPLLIWEIGSSGHLDSVVMALLVLALLFRYRRQPVWTGLFLGLAVLTKFYPLVLFPALWQRGDWKMPATMAALAAVTYSVYLSVGSAVFGFFGGYVQEEGMASGTRYFPLEYLQHLPGLAATSNTAYLLFAAAVLGYLCLWAWRVATPQHSAPAAFLAPAFALATATMLLFSPHYPWYVAWLIPFLVLLPNLTAMTYVCGLFYLCTTALAVGSGPKQFHLNEILYSAVLVALIMELTLRSLPRTRGWFLRPRPTVLPRSS